MKNLIRLPETDWPSAFVKPLCVWLSPRYQVSLWLERDGQLVLSIARRDGRPGISWDKLQAIKTAAGFGTWQAVEIYPPDTQVVNQANMRHLWLSHERKPIGWHKLQQK